MQSNEIFNSLFPTLTESDIKANALKFKISKAIYLKRKEMKLSQNKFAEYLGVTQAMVSKWESFRYNFTIEAIVDIFSKLNIPFDRIVNQTEQYKASQRRCQEWGNISVSHERVSILEAS